MDVDKILEMTATILSAPPVSGSVPEYYFDAVGDCTWVEFRNQTAKSVGVFGNGSLTSLPSSVIQFCGRSHYFILASGQGYVISFPAITLSYKTKIDYLTAAVAVPQTNLVVASHNTGIILYNPYGIVWESVQLANDELKIERVTENEVSGQFWEPSGYKNFLVQINAHSRANWLTTTTE